MIKEKDIDIFEMFGIDPKKKSNKQVLEDDQKQLNKQVLEDDQKQLKKITIKKTVQSKTSVKKTPTIKYKSPNISLKSFASSNQSKKTKSISSDLEQVSVLCPISNKKYIYAKPDEPKLGPYGTSWVHDKIHKSDDLNSEHKESTKIVKNLLKLEFPPQRSKGWFDARKTCISASDGGCAVGDNQHEPQYMIYIKKLLEPVFEPNYACYHGTKFEQIATMVYEYRMDVKVEEFGLVKHPIYKFLGASPDGIIGKYKLNGKDKTQFVGRMLEIKCPNSRQINDKNPFEEILYYKRQVLLQLEATGLEECDFWQVRIKEYKDRVEFIDDTDSLEPFRSVQFGMEKGCLIQLLPKDSIAKLVEKHDEIVWGSSKFIYPSKIDMSPLECDIWISQCVSDIEKTLRNTIYESHKETKDIILNAICNAHFLIYYKDDINEKVAKVLKWLKEEKNVLISKAMESNQFTKKSNELVAEFSESIHVKLNDLRFVKFLLMIEISEYDDIKNDKNLISKLLDPDSDQVFAERINTDKNLVFIKNLSRLIRDLEYPKKYLFHKVIYWRVEKTNCTLVKRDDKWFQENLQIFQNIWNNIEYLREHSDVLEIILNYIESLPTVKVEFGKNLKDNKKVTDLINHICNPPDEHDEKAIKKFHKIVKIMLEDK
jgi:putative phage-type endonuclease